MFLILTILSVMQSTRRKMTVKPKEASQLKIVKYVQTYIYVCTYTYVYMNYYASN